MFPIQRIPGSFPTRSWGSAYRDLVWAFGMSDDEGVKHLIDAARRYLSGGRETGFR